VELEVELRIDALSITLRNCGMQMKELVCTRSRDIKISFTLSRSNLLLEDSSQLVQTMELSWFGE